MPVRKSVPSLVTLSLNKTAEIIDMLTNQMEGLPIWIYDSLFELMKENDKNHNENLRNWFIRPHKKKLDHLRIFRSKNSPFRADLLVERIAGVCVQLTELSIADLPTITEVTLLMLIPKIANIEILNLRNTQCTDRVLIAMNQHSSKLWDLDVSRCPVTNTGITSLNDISANIKILDISDTRITRHAGLRILKTFTALTEFTYHQTKKLVLSLKNNNQISPLLNLQSLPAYCVSSMTEFQILARLFPELRQITSGCMTRGQRHLATFHNLDKFDLQDVSSPPGRSEGRALVRLLLNINCNLTRLYLQNVRQLDVGVIANHFPSLKSLGLHETSICERTTECANPFPNLVDVDIDVNNSHVSVENLRFLLPHSLCDVYICRCNILTDEVVANIFLSGDGFMNLKYLRFIECSGLTAVGLTTLLIVRDMNVLQKLYAIDCPLIKKQQRDGIEFLIKRKNLDVQVFWV